MIALLWLACAPPGAAADGGGDVKLEVEQPVEVALPSHGTVELAGVRVDLLEDLKKTALDASGRRSEYTEGRLRLTRGDEVVEQAFRAGAAFERWGATWYVRGEAGSLSIGVYPPGAPLPK